MEMTNDKKTYTTPAMETFQIQTVGPLLETSNLVPKERGGGGNGGSRLFEGDEIDDLLGDGASEWDILLP